jgi:hypothetical protein
MSFYFAGYDNRGYFVEIPAALAVVECFVDSITVPWDISVPNITYADFAIVDTNDIWASTATDVFTFLDMAVVGPVDDVAVLGVVIADILDFSVDELHDVFTGTATVTVTLDFDTLEDDDVWTSAQVVSAGMALAVTDVPDEYDGRAFVGYFFLTEQEILYVSSENTTMTIPYNMNHIRIAAKPLPPERFPVDTTMITKKRNRSRLQ